VSGLQTSGATLVSVILDSKGKLVLMTSTNARHLSLSLVVDHIKITSTLEGAKSSARMEGPA